VARKSCISALRLRHFALLNPLVLRRSMFGRYNTFSLHVSPHSAKLTLTSEVIQQLGTGDGFYVEQ
jgi:hypothetical protein